MTSDNCQYCGNNEFRMDNDVRPGKGVRICTECNKAFDEESEGELKARHLQECFEENN